MRALISLNIVCIGLPAPSPPPPHYGWSWALLAQTSFLSAYILHRHTFVYSLLIRQIGQLISALSAAIITHIYEMR